MFGVAANAGALEPGAFWSEAAPVDALVVYGLGRGTARFHDKFGWRAWELAGGLLSFSFPLGSNALGWLRGQPL